MLRRAVAVVETSAADVAAALDQAPANPQVPEDRPTWSQASGAILNALGVPVVVNLIALTLSIAGWWQMLAIAWPMEFFLLAGVLSTVMAAKEILWMLVPIGALLGGGIAFLYSTTTGNWEHWVFLWAVELWWILSAVWALLWLTRRTGRPARLSRALGNALTPVFMALGGTVLLVTIVVLGLRPLVGWVTGGR